MQTAAKESLMHQFSVLQDRIKSVEEQRDQIRSELMKLESAGKTIAEMKIYSIQF